MAAAAQRYRRSLVPGDARGKDGFDAHRGSHAQRDIIAWTLLEAALRADRFKLARALANERTAIKPTSPQNWRYAARALQGLGDYQGAERARARVASCALKTTSIAARAACTSTSPAS